MKYLILIFFVGVVWWVFKNRARRPVVSERTPPEPEMMVVCAHCGVHLPQGDSISGDGEYYCSEAHQQAGKASRRP